MCWGKVEKNSFFAFAVLKIVSYLQISGAGLSEFPVKGGSCIAA